MRGWLYVCLWALPALASARHIIGGELTMQSLGKPGFFRVQMDQYWNEVFSSSGNNDPTIRLFIYRKRQPQLVQSLTLPLLGSTPIVYGNAACAKSQRLQTKKGTYSRDIQFDPANYTDPGGYYMVWERCCRDNAITNLANPVDVGMVFYLEFPAMLRNGAAFTNSSPVFDQPNGLYICLNKPTTFAFAATDADGDQLRYSLVTPYQGFTSASTTFGNDTPKSAYPLVTWGAGFAADQAIPGNPALQINAATGQLTVRASKAGYYLFSVQCDEYRGGERIGSTRRDFVLPVVDCNLTPLPPPVIQAAGVPLPELKICPGTSATVTVEADPQWAYQWQLNGSNITGATSATLTIQQVGTYTVQRSVANKCANDTLSQPLPVKLDTLPAVAADSVPPLCASGEAITLRGQPAGGAWQGLGTSAGGQFVPAQVGEGLHPITYTVVGANRCPNATTRWVRVTPPLRLEGPVSYRIQRNTTAPLTQTPSEAAATVGWSPPLYLSDPDSPTPLCTPADSQTYAVRAETESGCTATATVRVQVIDRLYVPTAFSPNGDQQNDVWKVMNTDSYPDCDVTVYNRWGELIYRCVGQTGEPWDGTYQRQPVEAGVYTYLIRPAPGEPVLRGSVMVVR